MYRSAVSSLSTDHWRGRRVLVTGASGFLGTWLCQLLMAEGATVHGLGRRNRPTHTHHPLQASLPKEAASLVESVAPDTIFHLASPIYFGEDPQETARLEQGIVDATEALLAAATGRNIRFVHAGSCAEYGRAPAPPPRHAVLLRRRYRSTPTGPSRQMRHLACSLPPLMSPSSAPSEPLAPVTPQAWSLVPPALHCVNIHLR